MFVGFQRSWTVNFILIEVHRIVAGFGMSCYMITLLNERSVGFFCNDYAT